MVDEKAISKLMETLEITREEALELVAFDKGDEDNEEVKKIEEKSTGQPKKKAKTGSPLDKVKTQKAKKKVDEFKDGVVTLIKEMINNHKEKFTSPQQMTSTKITFKGSDGNYYSISLTKHKAKPDGYVD